MNFILRESKQAHPGTLWVARAATNPAFSRMERLGAEIAEGMGSLHCLPLIENTACSHRSDTQGQIRHGLNATKKIVRVRRRSDDNQV
jgi:hypothetical protein